MFYEAEMLHKADYAGCTLRRHNTKQVRLRPTETKKGALMEMQWKCVETLLCAPRIENTLRDKHHDRVAQKHQVPFKT